MLLFAFTSSNPQIRYPMAWFHSALDTNGWEKRWYCPYKSRAIPFPSVVGWRSLVKHLLLCRIERRPPGLNMENYPHLPLAEVSTHL